MSVNYGGPPMGGAGYGGSGYGPPGRVNFGWIGQAFELFKANVGVWIVATLLLFVPSFLSGIISASFGAAGPRQPLPASLPTGINAFTNGLPPALYFTLQLLNILYAGWLYGGVYGTAVKQVRGEAISIGDLFTGGATLGKMIGWNIIYGLAVGIGFVLCIVPGILIAGLLFPVYAMLANGESLGNAISRSFEAMKQDMWNAAAFALVISLLAFAGVVACFVGVFVTMPIFFLCGALAYRDMVGMPGTPPGGFGGMGGYAPPQAGIWPPPPETRPPSFGQPPPPSYPPTNPPAS